MKRIETIELPQASPGTCRSLTVIRYGTPGNNPKVYIQAGLHADEAPGFLVAHHLQQQLDSAEIIGEIILVPVANPIGLTQWRDDLLRGRFDFANSINFNRQHIDLAAQISIKAQALLTDDPNENISVIRKCTAALLEEITPMDEASAIKKILFSLAHDADIVLDLHCDNDALLHVYMGTPLWPEGSDLSAYLGAEATLLAKKSGGDPFDEACGRIWWELSEKFPSHPIPQACLAATIELRGIADTDHTVAAQDAGNIIAFLQHRNCVQGAAPELPQLRNEATPLTGVDYLKAETPGIVVFLKKPGEYVKKGDIIAEIINPLPAKGQPSVHTLRCRTDGLLFTRNYDRFARPGRILAKVTGKKPLRDAGENLLTL
jgi:predicted deacylase